MATEGTAAFPARPTPWRRAVGLSGVLADWRENARVAPHVVLQSAQEARSGTYAPFPEDLSPALREALRGRGIERLYAHQARAYTLLRQRQDVVVATPTASGKSLCYNLPILQHWSEAPQSRALYLFPTKALARDQEATLLNLLEAARLQAPTITYDGDTPGDVRRAARERSCLLITNPDMLHAGILAHHAAWARLFANLDYVVIDELHTYRGIFGSHFANVLRRLLRIAAFYGSAPTFAFASATIGNAQAHASRILGREVQLVGESSAPSGSRQVWVVNPPVVNATLGVRESCVKTAVRLAYDLVVAKVPTLIFGQSRNQVEVMFKYLCDRLVQHGYDAACVHSYRGGYLPQQRRRIEAGLRDGEILCVVATSALELGIDIGALDAVICTGYPGSIAALWQRFGRGGRRSGVSLGLLVTSSAALDQYWALHPEALVGAAVEEARIDPDNVEILVQHLKCAAFELPFVQGQPFGSVPPAEVGEALDFLVEHQVLHPALAAQGPSTYHWATDHYPAKSVSLRQIAWDNFVIIDSQADKTIAEMDWRATHTMLHEQAIYQHAGEQWQVERLDFENRKAYVRKVCPDYYTDAITHVKVTILTPAGEQPLRAAAADAAAPAPATAGYGDVSLVEKVMGFKKIKYHTHENVGFGEVFLPEMQMHTTALWLRIAAQTVARLALPRPQVIDGLRGLAQALHTVAAVGLMTEPRDIGCTVSDAADVNHAGKQANAVDFDPTVFLYERSPGGTGLAQRLFEDCPTLLQRAAQLLQRCPCAAGCPGCVGPTLLSGAEAGGPAANDPRSHPDAARKATAMAVVRLLIADGAAAAQC